MRSTRMKKILTNKNTSGKSGLFRQMSEPNKYMRSNPKSPSKIEYEYVYDPEPSTSSLRELGGSSQSLYEDVELFPPSLLKDIKILSTSSDLRNRFSSPSIYQDARSSLESVYEDVEDPKTFQNKTNVKKLICKYENMGVVNQSSFKNKPIKAQINYRNSQIKKATADNKLTVKSTFSCGNNQVKAESVIKDRLLKFQNSYEDMKGTPSTAYESMQKIFKSSYENMNISAKNVKNILSEPQNVYEYMEGTPSKTYELMQKNDKSCYENMNFSAKSVKDSLAISQSNNEDIKGTPSTTYELIQKTDKMSYENIKLRLKQTNVCRKEVAKSCDENIYQTPRESKITTQNHHRSSHSEINCKNPQSPKFSSKSAIKSSVRRSFLRDTHSTERSLSTSKTDIGIISPKTGSYDETKMRCLTQISKKTRRPLTDYFPSFRVRRTQSNAKSVPDDSVSKLRGSYSNLVEQPKRNTRTSIKRFLSLNSRTKPVDIKISKTRRGAKLPRFSILLNLFKK